MARVDEVPGEQSASAAELEDEPTAQRFEKAEDPRRAGIGVEAEAEVVYQREVVAIVRQAVSPAGSPHVCQHPTSTSTLIPL